MSNWREIAITLTDLLRILPRFPIEFVYARIVRAVTHGHLLVDMKTVPSGEDFLLLEEKWLPKYSPVYGPSFPMENL